MQGMIGMQNKKRFKLVTNFGIVSRFVLPVSLTIAIVISLIFTGLISINPAHFTHTNKSTTRSTAENSTITARTISDIYSPTQVLQTDASQAQKLLYDNKVNVINEVQKSMRQWQFTKTSKVNRLSAQAYAQLLQQANMLLLNYPDLLAGSLFNTVYQQKIKFDRKLEFNRILIPTKNPKHIYLLNDSQFSVQALNVTPRGLKKLLKKINQASGKVPVSERLYEKNVLLTYTQGVTLKQYSYLLNKQTANSLVKGLLNNGGLSSVKTKKKTNRTVYEDGNFRRMTVFSKSGVVSYQNFDGSRDTTGYSKILRNAYTDLVSIGVPLDNMRFFETNEDATNFVYRTYVEGFPIFNQTRYGSVQLNYDTQGNTQMRFSLYSLQVPLPNNKPTVTLMSSDAVLARLVAHGIAIKKIQDMQVGYRWTTNSSSNMVIDLKPVWYIEINDEWLRLDQWLTKNNN